MAGHALDYRWNLRGLMTACGINTTTELNLRLRQRGVELSPMQVCHLVAEKPDRLSVRVMLALCDVLDCSLAELIEPRAEVPVPRTAASESVVSGRIRGLD